MKDKKRLIIRILCVIFTVTATLAVIAATSACNTDNDTASRDLYVISASFDGDRTLSANERVFFKNRTDGAMYRIYLHLYPRAYESDAQFKACDNIASPGSIVINDVGISVPGGYEIEGQDNDVLAIVPDEPVLPDESVTIEISFTLVLPKVDHRLGVNSLGIASFGNWYPILCAEKDTSPYYPWGDPFFSETANYEVSVSVPENLTVAMTGEERVVDTGNGRKSVVSNVKNVRDFALLVGEFEKISAKAGKTTVSYYYVRDDAAQNSLSTAVAAIATFERLFGEYHYADYDVVQTLPGSGGMEYPCLSMVSAANNRSLYDEVIIHETAHQWWYGIVGNNQIENAWQDEGLAEYSTTLFYENNPSYNVKAERRINDAASAYLLYLDVTLEKEHSMSRRLPEFLSAVDYTYVSYVKGELFFHALRELIGDDAFFKGLRRYVSENACSIACPDDFIAAMEYASGTPLKGYCDGWLLGKDVVAS